MNNHYKKEKLRKITLKLIFSSLSLRKRSTIEDPICTKIWLIRNPSGIYIQHNKNAAQVQFCSSFFCYSFIRWNQRIKLFLASLMAGKAVWIQSSLDFADVFVCIFKPVSLTLMEKIKGWDIGRLSRFNGYCFCGVQMVQPAGSEKKLRQLLFGVCLQKERKKKKTHLGCRRLSDTDQFIY